jgi:tartrate/fumarate subfamily iron-sulfur-dependent hydro-lyase beta chain
MIKNLKLPLDEKNVNSLKAGELVTFTGAIFTGRESFYIRAVEEKILPGLDFCNTNVMMHVGPVVEKQDSGWKVLSLTPTTSIRMEKYAGRLIKKLKTRGLIGKGTMGNKTMKAIKETGALHFSPTAIYPVLLARQVKRVKKVFFLEELGPTEATWIFEVESFGPFLVDMDRFGNNYFDRVIASSRGNIKKVYKKHDIPLNYKYTPI